MQLIEDIKSQFKSGTNLMKLIYINTGVFLIIKVIQMFAFLFQTPEISDTVISFLAVPASLEELIRKPWTVFSYMFLHEGFFHLLFNMLWLYWFSRIFTQYFDQKKLVSLYIMGGLAGAFLYILSFNMFPAFSEVINISIALGASASVMAIVVATATYVPNYSVRLFFVGQVKLKYIAIGILIFTSILDFSENTGGKIAHLGGAALGYFYANRLKYGSDPGIWISRLLANIKGWFKPRQKMKVTHKKQMNDHEYNEAKASHQEQLNKILEKISKGGYESLTSEEKALLFKESQKK
jgi:membrane associated rhomboid family serine protease